jgi:malonyl-CoA/methylmalonyl-CoA synthetase
VGCGSGLGSHTHAWLLLLLATQIQGRTTVDIIKSGGFKLSALDIESALLHHPGVSEVAVLGVPDEQLGQRVAALVVAAGAGVPQEQLVQGLQALCEASLPLYSVPRQWLVLSRPLPRNAMGKVNKKALLAAFQQQLMPGGGGSMTA